MGSQTTLAETVEHLLLLVIERGLGGDDEINRRLAMARAEVAALRAMTYASVSRNAKQASPDRNAPC